MKYIGTTYDREVPGLFQNITFKTPWDTFTSPVDARTIKEMSLSVDKPNQVYTFQMSKDGLSMGLSHALTPIETVLVWRGDDPNNKDENAIIWSKFWTRGDEVYRGEAAARVFEELKAAYRQTKRGRGGRGAGRRNQAQRQAAISEVLWDRHQNKAVSWKGYLKKLSLSSTLSHEALQKHVERAIKEAHKK